MLIDYRFIETVEELDTIQVDDQPYSEMVNI